MPVCLLWCPGKQRSRWREERGCSAQDVLMQLDSTDGGLLTRRTGGMTEPNGCVSMWLSHTETDRENTQAVHHSP